MRLFRTYSFVALFISASVAIAYAALPQYRDLLTDEDQLVEFATAAVALASFGVGGGGMRQAGTGVRSPGLYGISGVRACFFSG